MNALEVRRLSVRFPSRSAPALADVSCGLEEGELVVLAGPSGSGKSTLLHTAIGYIPEGIPAEVSGEVLLGGRPAPRDLARRAQRLGLVQQDPEAGLCTLRVKDEVAFGPENLGLPRSEIAARVEKALTACGMTALAQRATWSLSGGEKQRTALAAVLALEPEVLLLDEPTAHLDPQAAQDLLLAVGRQAAEGRGVLVAEHRLGPLRAMGSRLVPLGGEESGGEAGEERLLRPQRPASGAAVVEARGLRVSYPGGKELLGGLSFRLAPGEVLGVVGPNGAGKSTLLRLVGGLVKPQEGSLRVVGRDPASLGPEERQRSVAMVFQMPHHQLFAPTVAEEFSLGQSKTHGVDGWLDRAGLSGLAQEHPLRLSIGERRRLTVALALAQRPRILLMDEPFIGQDRWNAAWVARQILQASRAGVGVVVASHNLPMLARIANRVVFLGEESLFGQAEDVFTELALRGREVFTPEYWGDPW
ncbi:MAG: ATP-binding cassette domain-containing protein [Candidatus Bipolaricaulota bacterium]